MKNGQTPPLNDVLSEEADLFAAGSVEEFNSKQAELGEKWGFDEYNSWEFNPETSILRLKFEGATDVEARCGFFATYCTDDQTLEWCWNNPRYPKAMIEASHTVREFGEKFELKYLTQGMIPVPTDTSLSYVCSLALKANEAMGVFRGSEGEVHPLFVVFEVRRDG